MKTHNAIGADACRPLAIRWFSSEMRPLVGRSRASVPSFLVLRDLIVAVRAVPRGGRRSAFARVVTVPSKSRSRPADLLSGRVALLTAEQHAYLPVSGIDP